MAFGRLRENVYKRNRITRDTKLRVYSVVELSTLNVYEKHARNLMNLNLLERLDGRAKGNGDGNKEATQNV